MDSKSTAAQHLTTTKPTKLQTDLTWLPEIIKNRSIIEKSFRILK